VKAVLIYDSGKLRRIAVGEGRPSAFVRERVREVKGIRFSGLSSPRVYVKFRLNLTHDCSTRLIR